MIPKPNKNNTYIILELTQKELDIIITALEDNTKEERHQLSIEIQNGKKSF